MYQCAWTLPEVKEDVMLKPVEQPSKPVQEDSLPNQDQIFGNRLLLSFLREDLADFICPAKSSILLLVVILCAKAW